DPAGLLVNHRAGLPCDNEVEERGCGDLVCRGDRTGERSETSDRRVPAFGAIWAREQSKPCEADRRVQGPREAAFGVLEAPFANSRRAESSRRESLPVGPVAIGRALDFYFSYRLSRCKAEVSTLIPMWVDVWTELEALVSLS